MKRTEPTIEHLDILAAKYSICQNFKEFCKVAPLVDAKCCNHQRDKVKEVKALRRAYKKATGLNLPHNPVRQRNHKLDQSQHQKKTRNAA